MCDEFIAEAEDRALARRGLTRREFAALGTAAALAGCAGAAGGTAAGESELRERRVQITTADGIADAFFVHPAQGAYPGVIAWPDIAGVRDALKIIARRLASAGYAVLVVNQYYRSAPAPVMESFSEFMEDEGRERVMAYRELLTPEAVTSDARAYVAFLDGDAAVDKTSGIGSIGYCMGGPFTIRTAAAMPSRVRAAVSFHGGGLVTDEPDSPHRLFDDLQAALLIAVARDDDERFPDHKRILSEAGKAADVPIEVEVFPADHGWCVPDAPAYEPIEADRAFAEMLTLFETL